MLINCYKNLFGSDIIVSDAKVARVNGKVTKIIQHDFNVELITEHINLILHRRQSYDIDEKICAKYDIAIIKQNIPFDILECTNIDI